METKSRGARLSISPKAHLAVSTMARMFSISKGDLVEVLIASALFQNYPHLGKELVGDELALATAVERFQVQVKIANATR